MQLSKSNIQITERTAIELFYDGIKVDATRNDYTNKLKKSSVNIWGKFLQET